jgi:hypothetical protein
MADAFTIRVTGLKEKQSALYGYSQRAGDFVIYKSIRPALNVIKKESQINAPFKTGKLKRGFRVVRSRIHRGKMSNDMIGMYLTIASKKKTDPFYGRFQEDGWRAGKAKRLIPGKKFIDNAFISKREEAVRVFSAYAIAAADQLANKMGL